MKIAIFALGIVLAAAAFGSRAEAQNYPWCAYWHGTGGARNCGFVSFEQCLENVRGIGGFCQKNDWYHPAAAAAPQYTGRKHHHSQS